MINTFILILFFLYSIILFFISNYYIFLSILILNLFLLIILKINIKKYLSFLKKNILFIVFIFILNLLFSNLNYSLIYSIRLFLVLNMSYIISYYFNYSKIVTGFYYLFYPLKIFKINPKDISLIISISLTYITIFIEEIKNIKLALKSMGFELNIKNALTKPHIYLIVFINNLLNRVEEIDLYLSSTGYNS